MKQQSAASTVALALSVMTFSIPGHAAGFSELGPRARERAFSISNIFAVSLDRQKHVVNQSDGGEELVMDDFSAGFRVISNTDAGIGQVGPMHFPIPRALGVGIDLELNKSVASDRYAATQEDANKMKKPVVPYDSSVLDSWHVGDNLTAMTQGGIGFSAGPPDLGPINVGPYFWAEGDWVIYVEKTAEDHVYLKITKSKLRSFGVYADTSGMMGIGAEKFKSTDNAFSFRYDLSSERGRFAFEDAMKGHLKPSEDISDKEAKGPVIRAEVTRNASLGYVRYWYLSLFFWNHSATQGKVYATSDERNHEDGSSSHVEYAMWLNEATTGGIFSRHKQTTDDFYAEYYTHEARDGKVTHGYSGTFTWEIQRNKVGEKALQKFLDKLTDKTGLDDDLALKLPKTKNDYGYMDVMFEAYLGQDAVDELMDTVIRRGSAIELKLSGTAQALMNAYFAKGDDEGLCPAGDQKPPADEIDDCKSRVNEASQTAVRKMVDELKMMAGLKESDQKEFVKHFAEFGRQMTANRFTFGAIMSATSAEPMDMNLSITGSRVSKFSLDIDPGRRSLVFDFLN